MTATLDRVRLSVDRKAEVSAALQEAADGNHWPILNQEECRWLLAEIAEFDQYEFLRELNASIAASGRNGELPGAVER